MKLALILGLFAPLPLFAGDLPLSEDEEQKFCDKPKFTMVGALPDYSKVNPSLLNPDEVLDPEIGRKLAIQPGPYGHSELGFRYLARLFGYPGTFEGKDKVERWLAEQEENEYNEKRGLRYIWRRWVVDTKYRLAVPTGPISKIPANANPEIFFNDLYEKMDFSHCVRQEQATLFCQNYFPDQHLVSNVRVTFAKAENRGPPCIVHDFREQQRNEQMKIHAWEAGIKTPSPLSSGGEANVAK